MTMDREQSSLVSRRSILTAALTALAGAAFAAVSVPALANGGPDGELLRLNWEHDAIYARSLRLGPGGDALDDGCRILRRLRP